MAGGLGTLGMASVVSNAAETGKGDAPYKMRTSASGKHVPAIVIDTNAMPWDTEAGALGWGVKTLFENSSTSDVLKIIKIPIGGPGAKSHYHDFHEWAYWLTGDFVNNEYASPFQRIGPFTQFREGVFLDRPAYSLHGYEDGRLESQVGGTCLIMEEGGRSINVVPGEPGYSEEFRDVEQWTNPRIIDTIHEQPWQADPNADGVMIKYLVENRLEGFRAVLRRLPSGWKSSQAREFSSPYFYRKAHQFNFVLAGDIRLQAWASPESAAEKIHAHQYDYIERPPMSILGLTDGVVSDAGAVWLEVTYGEGTALSSTPIEEKVFLT